MPRQPVINMVEARHFSIEPPYVQGKLPECGLLSVMYPICVLVLGMCWMHVPGLSSGA